VTTNIRRILLTGGSGALGREIQGLLHDDERYAVLVTTHPEAGPHGLDVTDVHSVRATLQSFKPDLIFHLAAIVPIPIVDQDHEKTVKVNVVGLDNILKGVESLNQPVCTVVVSSSEIYGNGTPERKFIESDPYSPSNFYAFTKVAQEQIALLYQRRGLQIKTARVFNYSSIYKEPVYSLESFADQIARIIQSGTEKVIRVGNLEPKRDFLQGSDVARALLAIGTVDSHETLFNVSRGEAVTMQSLLESLIAEFSAKVDIVPDPQRYRKIDNLYVCGDNSRLRALNWKPRMSLEEMVKILVQHTRKKHGI
jgi:GDP-4-dehydro-6-deoxy-D-mannose reductase